MRTLNSDINLYKPSGVTYVILPNYIHVQGKQTKRKHQKAHQPTFLRGRDFGGVGMEGRGTTISRANG